MARSRTALFIPSTTRSLITIRDGIGKFHPYNMKGAQKATTTVRCNDGRQRTFKTTANMHSEMMALNHMLETNQWRLVLGAVIKADLTDVGPQDFQTTEPHCGFCTVMLRVLHLPLTKPTRGNYNYAVNFNYPLPALVKSDPYVLARVLDEEHYASFNKIKALLNSFVETNPDEWILNISNFAFVNDDHYVDGDDWETQLAWDEVVAKDGGGLLNAIWAHVFKCIYETNQD